MVIFLAHSVGVHTTYRVGGGGEELEEAGLWDLL